ncbi:MAG: glycosyltransferase family 4 protein [Thermodesulfobacteriota bacterium]
MRIGIDAHILGKQRGGVERYVAEIVARVPALLPEHRFFVFVNRRFAKKVFSSGNVTYVATPLSDPILQRSVILPVLARRWRIDLLHTQRVLPFFAGCRCLVSMHDILPLSAPDNHRGFRNFLIRRLTPGSARRAVAVLTVSRTVRREIIETLGVSEEKVKVVYNGLYRPSPQTAAPDENETGIPPPYILYAGAIERRKNLLCLVRAFGRMREKTKTSLTLVIAGMDRDNAYKKELRALIGREGLDDRVIFTGFVRDTVLTGLYRNADMLVAPSMGEGFDLPPLEAMALGTPVICSDIEVHRELLDDAAVFFDPVSADGLAAAILSFYAHPEQRKALVDRGLAVAGRFTWEETARQTADIYREAFENGPAGGKGRLS